MSCRSGKFITTALQEALVNECCGQSGRGSRARFAMGTSWWNLAIWKWEIASATLLSIPDMCIIQTLMLSCSKVQQTHQSHHRWIMCGALFPDIYHCSTALLAQWNTIFCLIQWVLQVCTAIIMANNSFQAMLGFRPVTTYQTNRPPLVTSGIQRHLCTAALLCCVTSWFEE